VESDEARISREFRREAKKSLRLVRHPEVERYLDKVGRRILSTMGPQPFEYRFFVVEDSRLNAFAVPGGSIYVFTGLLERIDSTDELAGVLGHEIAHVHHHHSAKLSGLDPISLLGLLGVFLAGSGGLGQAAGAVAQGIAATRQLSFNRELEREADTFGVKYVSQAGYDPEGVLRFLKVIDKERALNPVDIPPYLLTHPVTQERISDVERIIRASGARPSRPVEPDPLKKIQVTLRFLRHEVDAVISEQERLSSQSPESAEPAYLLGLAYHYQARWPEARRNYERARELEPQNASISRDLGRLYLQSGEYDRALSALEQSRQAEPKESLTYLYLGELQEKRDRPADAVGAYLTAHNLSPLWAEPAYRLGVLHGKMNRLGDAYYYLGKSKLLLDEDEKAAADFERAIKSYGPDSPRGQLVKEELETLRARK
jgi:predicted Zn-dependent protease